MASPVAMPDQLIKCEDQDRNNVGDSKMLKKIKNKRATYKKFNSILQASRKDAILNLNSQTDIKEVPSGKIDKKVSIDSKNK